MTPPVDIPALRKILEDWRIGRDKELLAGVEQKTLYWRLMLDGAPTTVPQSCAEFYNANDLPIVNALGPLLDVYEAAETYCDVHYKGISHPRYPAYPCDELLLAVNAIRLAAIDRARRK